MIAGSYAPICLITLDKISGLKIFIAVLAIALIGTVFKIFFTGKFDKLSLLLYLAMGWLVVLDFKNVFNALEFNGLILLGLSGLLYSFGTIFYSLEKMKYSHAIMIPDPAEAAQRITARTKAIVLVRNDFYKLCLK